MKTLKEKQPDRIKIGLEIHVQLNTNKLFCGCKGETGTAEKGRFSRTLYSTTGEFGLIDPAAIFEASRGRVFNYAITENSCLVEMDEEPPHPINEDALKIALRVSAALKTTLLDNIFVMRKIVIDGSNTTGFQRTALVGFNGSISLGKTEIGISTVCLEEDSARKIESNSNETLYSLDRLGIPLIEISTDPDIKSAEETIEVAKMIGQLVESTGRTRRGADAIRQDVNLSIGYGRVEIKGVSKLSQIRKAINSEIDRQENLAVAISTLRDRGFSEMQDVQMLDITEKFVGCGSRVIENAIASGRRVYGFLLPSMAGLLRAGKMRIGREIADELKQYGIRGFMHGDELPGYGIESDLVDFAKNALSVGKTDSFGIVAIRAEERDTVKRVVRERINKIIRYDFSETRYVDERGITHYLRPLPGRNRMYPETDIPPFTVGPEMMREVKGNILKPYAEQVNDLVSRYRISKQDAEAILKEGLTGSFTRLADIVEGRLAARILIHTVPRLSRDFSISIEPDVLLRLLSLLAKRGWERYSLEPSIIKMHREGMTPEEVIQDPAIRPLTEEELRDLVGRMISSMRDLSEKHLINEIRRSQERPFDPSLVIQIYRDLKKSSADNRSFR